MTAPGTPQIQIAYQGILQKQYQAAWKPFVNYANQMSAGTGLSNAIGSALTGTVNGPAWAALPMGGKGRRPVPVGGNCAQISSSGGSSYVANDIITFKVNSGRLITVKVVHVTAGAPDQWQITDPGSGLQAGGDGKNNYFGSAPTVTVTENTNSGSGTGATWTATPGVGGLFPQPSVQV